MTPSQPDRQSLALIVLIVFQTVCALFFLTDVVTDAGYIGVQIFGDPHLMIEALATFSLIVAIGIEAQFLMRIMRRQSRIERGISIASGALHELMEEYFRDWGLTPAEEDVASFVLKGLSIAEIAELRGSRDGTVKAHLNAIYRKAGVSGRSQLVSLLIEDLMGQPLSPDAARMV